MAAFLDGRKLAESHGPTSSRSDDLADDLDHCDTIASSDMHWGTLRIALASE
jgi:hypothetical protein